MSQSYFSFALGVGTQNNQGEWLEVFYPSPLLHPEAELIAPLAKRLGYQSGNQHFELNPTLSKELLEIVGEDSPFASHLKAFTTSKQPTVAIFLESDSVMQSTPECYLKLQLISHRLVKPHGTNLEGIFGLLPNVVWTNRGAIDVKDLTQKQLEARLQGEVLDVLSVDKFPKMSNYVIPSGIRIGDASRIRLGAYVGEGTTIMHEGFINFNAGALGPNMIEGRISSGVVIGSGSDLGAGCSTMGTLSGGNKVVISAGKDNLVGANAGMGIPLGDRCTIEAGLYVTAGAKVTVIDASGKAVEVIKARELAGKSDLLFIRNSQTGTIECRTNKSAIELNNELHAHN